MKPKYYRCNICGNIVEMVDDSGVVPVCCGEPMEELVADSVDATTEKHVPAYNIDGNVVTVQIGSEKHPMLDKHYIEWIELETEQGMQRKYLHPGEDPVATFVISDDDKLKAIYEYCNIHGLWNVEV